MNSLGISVTLSIIWDIQNHSCGIRVIFIKYEAVYALSRRAPGHLRRRAGKGSVQTNKDF